MTMLEPRSLELSLKDQAELLGLSRSSLYYPSTATFACRGGHQTPHRRDLHALAFLWFPAYHGQTQPGGNPGFAAHGAALYA